MKTEIMMKRKREVIFLHALHALHGEAPFRTSTMKDMKFHEGRRVVEFSELSNKVIGCAIEVHRVLGPGLLESAYEHCLAHELQLQGINFTRQQAIAVQYKGAELDCGYRADLIVENEILLELKSIDKLAGIHEAQLLTYMRLAGIKQGFLINFNVPRLKDGLKSFVL